MTKRVLVVEDDRDVANLLKEGLQDLADRVDQAHDGRTGLAMAEAADYALIVLDLMLPLLGGPKICELLRSAGSDAAILAVTARADLIAPLLGAQLGFDDYVLKPFELQELRAKSQRLLERRRRSTWPSAVVPDPASPVGGVTLDVAAKRVLVEGKPVVGLSSKECEIVSLLAGNPGMAFSKDELLAAVWGIYHPIQHRYLGLDLSRLRGKLTGARSKASYLTVTQDGRYMLLQSV